MLLVLLFKEYMRLDTLVRMQNPAALQSLQLC